MYIANAVNGSARFTSFREYFMNPSNILFMTKKGCVERVNSPVLNSDGNVVRLASRRIINDEGSLTLSFKERFIQKVKVCGRKALSYKLVRKALGWTGLFLVGGKKCNYLAAEIRHL